MSNPVEDVLDSIRDNKNEMLHKLRRYERIYKAMLRGDHPRHRVKVENARYLGMLFAKDIYWIPSEPWITFITVTRDGSQTLIAPESVEWFVCLNELDWQKPKAYVQFLEGVGNDSA